MSGSTPEERSQPKDGGSDDQPGGTESDDKSGGRGASEHRRVEVHPGKEVVVEFDPALTFECVEDCTWCCHHGVLLYEPDLLELAGCASPRKSVVASASEAQPASSSRSGSYSKTPW